MLTSISFPVVRLPDADSFCYFEPAGLSLSCRITQCFLPPALTWLSHPPPRDQRPSTDTCLQCGAFSVPSVCTQLILIPPTTLWLLTLPTFTSMSNTSSPLPGACCSSLSPSVRNPAAHTQCLCHLWSVAQEVERVVFIRGSLVWSQTPPVCMLKCP